MDEELQQIVDRMIAAGESDEDIGLVVQGWKPTTPSATSRFVEGVKRNANPIAILSGIKNAVMHPMQTLQGMEAQANENFAEAGRQWKAGDYGHAVMHGIAGAIPPFNIVTSAGDKVREGDIAGGLGEATGAVLTAKAPGVIKSVPHPSMGTIVDATTAVAKNAPVISPAIRGTIRDFRKAQRARVATPAVVAKPPVAKAEVLPPATPGTSVATESQKLLTPGAHPMPAGPDPSYVRSIPAKYGEPMDPDAVVPAGPMESLAARPVTPQPSAPTVTIPNLTKVDRARIIALDKELGTKHAGIALRHDPRFAGMSATQRTEVIRAISSEAPHALPAGAARIIDAKFAAINPAERAAYVESWKSVNPAVYSYLQQKLVQ